MISRREHEAACDRAWAELARSGIALRPGDRSSLVAADFGLSRLGAEGAQILTFFATERISAKAIVLFPGQHLPEHRHPPVPLGEGRLPDPGKEEILRVQAGTVMLGIEESLAAGRESRSAGEARGGVAIEKPASYRCTRQLTLGPGEQVTLPPGSWHWLAGGLAGGGVVLSFSTCVRDVLDEFRDPAIARTTIVVEDGAGGS